MKTPASQFQTVLQTLQKLGFLVESDPILLSVCSLITGEPIRGSWWSHRFAQRIFQVNEQLEDHPDVIITKLISGKVTFVHRSIWSELITIAKARAAWQFQKLSTPAMGLLAQVDAAGCLTSAEAVWPQKENVKLGDATRELEKKLLIVATQFHSESGAHQKRLQTWEHWTKERKFKTAKISIEEAKARCEKKLASLNKRFDADAKLPWQQGRGG